MNLELYIIRLIASCFPCKNKISSDDGFSKKDSALQSGPSRKIFI